MELVELVKYLAQVSSPGEFLMVMGVVLFIIFIGAKYFVTFIAHGRKFLNLFNGGGEHYELSEKIGALATDEQVERSSVEQREQFDQLMEIMKEQLAVSRELLSQHAVLKQQHDDIFREVHEDVEALNRELKDLSVALQSHNTIMRMDVAKNQELIIRVITQLEKIDEFAKVSVPEFRASFKEVIHDLKIIERDMALIDQLLQLQINSPGIKLK
jgi:hypothetical protein